MTPKYLITLLFISFSTLSFSQSVSSLYVSAEKGDSSNLGNTPEAPLKTIGQALHLAKAGMTIHVLPGIYNEWVLLEKTENLTLVADTTQGQVLIDGTKLLFSDRVGLITIREAKNIRIEGFEVANLETNAGRTPVGILVEGSCDSISIVNNKVHDIKNNASCQECAEGANGIGVYGTPSKGITNLVLDGNQVYNCVLSGSEAFVINGNVSGFIVCNNSVYNNNNIGFDFIGFEGKKKGKPHPLDRARNGWVVNNLAKNNSIFGHGNDPPTPNPWYQEGLDSNAGSAAGFYIDGGQYIILDRNTSTGNDIGIEVASEVEVKKKKKKKYGENVIVRNNIVFLNAEGGIVLGGGEDIYGGARKVFVVNNSLYKNRKKEAGRGWATEIKLQNHVNNCKFANNIIYGVDEIWNNYQNDKPKLNRSNFWGKNIWWGEINPTGGDLPGDTLLRDPLFVNPKQEDFSISEGSPAKDALPNFKLEVSYWVDTFWKAFSPIPSEGMKDRVGKNRRNGDGLDIGAYEYYPQKTEQ